MAAQVVRAKRLDAGQWSVFKQEIPLLGAPLLENLQWTTGDPLPFGSQHFAPAKVYVGTPDQTGVQFSFDDPFTVADLVEAVEHAWKRTPVSWGYLQRLDLPSNSWRAFVQRVPQQQPQQPRVRFSSTVMAVPAGSGAMAQLADLFYRQSSISSPANRQSTLPTLPSTPRRSASSSPTVTQSPSSPFASRRGTPVGRSGRSALGNLRNYGAMSDQKLLALEEQLLMENNDRVALDSVQQELLRREL